MPEQQPRPESAQQKIDDLIEGLGDWRGERLAEVRGLIRGALPGVSETWKWMGSPVWEQDGIVVVGNAHKTKVKLTFPRGAQLTDPDDLFNAGLGASAWRAIDLHEQNTLDPDAFRALVRTPQPSTLRPGGWRRPAAGDPLASGTTRAWHGGRAASRPSVPAAGHAHRHAQMFRRPTLGFSR